MSFTDDILRVSELIADVIRGGIIEGATIVASVFTGGTFNGGTFNAGTFDTPTITDPDVTGGTTTGTTHDTPTITDPAGSGGSFTGSLFRTSAAGARTEVSELPGAAGQQDVRFYSGLAEEDEFAYIGTVGSGAAGNRSIKSIWAGGKIAGIAARAFIHLITNETVPGIPDSQVKVIADDIELVSALGLGTIALTGEVWLAGYLQGRAIKNGFDFGTANGNVNASSQLSVPHGIGVAPTSIIPGNAQGNGRTVSIVGKTASAFTAEVRGPDGTTLAAGVAVSFGWVAVA